MGLELRTPSGRVTCAKARLLFIDESRFMRRLFTFIFEDLHYLVHTAADGREGVRLATQAPYDLIVVDGVLPDMDGRDVCRHLAALPGVKPVLILYSALAGHSQERYTAFRDGVDEFLRKDGNNDLLVERVEALISERDLQRLEPSA